MNTVHACIWGRSMSSTFWMLRLLLPNCFLVREIHQIAFKCRSTSLNDCRISFSVVIHIRKCFLLMDIVALFWNLNEIYTVLFAFKCVCFANPVIGVMISNKKSSKENSSSSALVDMSCRGGGWGFSKQLKRLYGLIIHRTAVIRLHWNLQQAISTIWTHRMEITDAISFLINRINSAMLNHNGSNKNSWCDNQSAPKTFITIIFISLRERIAVSGVIFERDLTPPVITLELAADTASTSMRYKTRGHREEHSFGFISDTSFDVGPFSEGLRVVRSNKHPAFWNISECEVQNYKVGRCAADLSSKVPSQHYRRRSDQQLKDFGRK